MELRTLLTFFALAATTGCSLLIDNNANQCATDRECARFPGTTCDVREHLCQVATIDSGAGGLGPAEGGSGGAGSCEGDGGCYACPPTDDEQFANACTDAKCKPFDNRARLRKLPEDGGLTPLPIADAQVRPE